MSTTAIPVDTHAYARFTRRLRAVMIDSIVFMLILAGTLIAATSLGSDNIARILGFVVVATWLLYEPVLVSMTGGTIGHWRSNLRVVDDAGGNISFGKAVIRVIIKTLLGWISFISMAATSRHQALHDIMTRSTVQIRDAANAEPHHFAQARAPLS
ncbi:MAG TPA: RDD family protein [Pseudolabrys sp.]|nr:RDD family protein [Pseudolabrys sp.]